MENTIRVFSGRTFIPEDIEMIKWARKAYPKLPRHEFAGTVCELLGWTTPAGNAKRVQCVAFLKRLEAEGIIQLPPVDTTKQNKCKVRRKVFEFDICERKGEVGGYEPVKLVVAKPGEELKRWRAYVDQYHMLGDKLVFGSRLHLIVNNSRFLIFPWVHIRNLASKALSLAAKQIQQDWLREYCYAPVLLETFVDIEKYQGISYKAANWLCLGETKGSGRSGRKKDILSRKSIFVYPLQDDFKACLKGEKPYKVVFPQ